MSSLSVLDVQRLERALGMQGNAVLDLTSEDLNQFVSDMIDHDLSDSRYERMGSSDASRLRALWQMEDDVVVADLIDALLELARRAERSPEDLAAGEAAVQRLRATTGPVVARRAAFGALLRSTRRAIEAGERAAAIEGLHASMTEYVNALCDAEIVASRPLGLEALLHELISEYERQGRIAAGLAPICSRAPLRRSMPSTTSGATREPQRPMPEYRGTPRD